jgi:hypothetical protein
LLNLGATNFSIAIRSAEVYKIADEQDEPGFKVCGVLVTLVDVTNSLAKVTEKGIYLSQVYAPSGVVATSTQIEDIEAGIEPFSRVNLNFPIALDISFNARNNVLPVAIATDPTPLQT